jgi:hypothetical protein
LRRLDQAPSNAVTANAAVISPDPVLQPELLAGAQFGIGVWVQP